MFSIQTQMYAIAGGIILALLLSGVILWQRGTIADLKGDVKVLETKHQTCVDTNNGLVKSIETQNVKVKEYQDAVAGLQAKIDGAVVTNTQTKKKTAEKVVTIIAAPPPKDKEAGFNSMVDFMKKEMGTW